MTETSLSTSLMQEIIFNTDSKLTTIRKYKKLSLCQAAQMSNITKDELKTLELSPINLTDTNLLKVCSALDIDENLLPNDRQLLSNQEFYLFNLIFNIYQKEQNIKQLQDRLLNLLSIILHNHKQEWLQNRKNSVKILYALDKKAEAVKRGKARDKKYAPFREQFKEIQYRKWLSYHKSNKKLTAYAFVQWFLKNKDKHMNIPYLTSNVENKLYQLAQANNREFKKAFEC